MIEHLFMLRCIEMHGKIDEGIVFRNTQRIANHPALLIRWIQAIHADLSFQLPSEAASLKGNPDVIQCDQCEGIFPSESIHYLAWLDADYCDGCLLVYYCDVWNMTTHHALLALAAQHFLT